MPVTLTDEQAAELRTRLSQAETNRQIAEAASKLWNDPERGNRAKALWKEQFPDSDLAEYDVEQRINQRLDREAQERRDAEKAAREREQDEQLARNRRETQERYKATDDAMTRLEKMMIEKNVGDYEVAAQHFFSREPQPSDDAGFDSQFWHHDRSDLFKEITADPEEWGRKEILKTIREGERRQPGRAW